MKKEKRKHRNSETDRKRDERKKEREKRIQSVFFFTVKSKVFRGMELN